LIGLWEGIDFSNRTDWFYELGLEGHSLVTDPEFVDPDGIDDVLAYVSAGLSADYFSNTDLSGSPVLERIDENVDFDWGYGSPGSGVSGNSFSVRWEGYIYIPEEGDYTFYTSVDDGERLYLDDILVIDCWIAGSDEQSSGAVTMTQGRHAITFEMFEDTGTASSILSWEGPGISKEPIHP